MILPQDTNPYGSVHGGVLMKEIDEAAAVAAMRHCRMNTVTASIDRLDFHSPVQVGELVSFKASVNGVGRTSLECGVRVEAENMLSGEVRHIASAFLTFVALDENGRPAGVPPLVPEDAEDERRMHEASWRRESRAARRRG
ncbi:acyl-CoA thioesterase [Desulfovibrio sp. X2]|uniref:acyl-CoA thioesterase n=1 Tax=Desulfovibrio sp. X2 TaxID=941449 RepID=UPI00068A9DEB|nr:acyl-CoA thioesterase [Desulfovibrio sp. X2]